MAATTATTAAVTDDGNARRTLAYIPLNCGVLADLKTMTLLSCIRYGLIQEIPPSILRAVTTSEEASLLLAWSRATKIVGPSVGNLLILKPPNVQLLFEPPYLRSESLRFTLDLGGEASAPDALLRALERFFVKDNPLLAEMGTRPTQWAGGMFTFHFTVANRDWDSQIWDYVCFEVRGKSLRVEDVRSNLKECFVRIDARIRKEVLESLVRFRAQ